MVKRSCPFNDDMNPQMKIHVREKEVAKGVMSDQHMKLVYDKTKELLFLGAKKTLTAPTLESNKCVNGSGTKEDALSQISSTTFKQMQLTSRGLLRSANGIQTSSHARREPCSTCSSWKPLDMFYCSFCDTSLCGSCTQFCVKCQDLVCCGCSFNVYDAAEGSICRNCC